MQIAYVTAALMSLPGVFASGLKGDGDAASIASRSNEITIVDDSTDELETPDISQCQGLCFLAAAMGCAGVGTLCGAGTTISLGGVAVPCTWAVMVACGAATYGSLYCIELCSKS